MGRSGRDGVIFAAMRTAGQWIRERREALKYTRGDVVRETKLGLATIARVEQDAGGNRSTVRAIGVALGLNEADADALALWAAGVLTETDFLKRTGGRRPDGTR